MYNYDYNNYGNYRKNNTYRKKNESSSGTIIVIFIIFFFVLLLLGSEDTGSTGYNGSSSNSSYTSTSSFFKIKEDRSTYIPKCKTISYSTLARNPYTYIGNNYKFTGEVIQVMNGYNNNIEMRVNVTPKRYEYINETYYEDTMYVTYQYSSSYESKILEGDIITMYGVFNGIQDYISVLGAQISIPKLDVLYIDNNY